MQRTVTLGRELTSQQVITLLSTLGGRIAYKRHELGMTQETLAKKLNVSQSLVSRWERNYERPMVWALAKLPEVLQTSRDWLTSNPLIVAGSDEAA